MVLLGYKCVLVGHSNCFNFHPGRIRIETNKKLEKIEKSINFQTRKNENVI